jgi:hypothetical protein
VAISAVMRPVSGTSRMALKFQLERRIGRTGPFAAVHGKDLGTWVYPTSPATLGQLPGDVWILKHNVVNLAGPEYYRFRVSFRWLGSDGRTLAQDARVSGLCYQSELRADLQVRSVTIKSLSPQTDRYTAVIRNSGLTAAGSFRVELRRPGAAPQSVVVPSLAPQTSVRETFSGPPCESGGAVTVVADTARLIDDRNRMNNALTVPCSTGTGP